MTIRKAKSSTPKKKPNGKAGSRLRARLIRGARKRKNRAKAKRKKLKRTA